MSIPSRIIANSLARNSIERTPAAIRGSLKTPASSRLYQSTNPSPSHVKIFSRSPRRERNTNRPFPEGSWPMTTFTRSARRSKPQRMSVASVASQMRTPCAPSNACKLGRPIMTRSRAQPAVRTSDSHQIQPPQKDCVPCSGESQSPDCAPTQAAHASWAPLLSLLQTSSLRLREFASSNRKKENFEYHGHDKMLTPSDRSDSALTPVRATSSTIPPCAVSSLKIHASRWRKQDGVKIALTKLCSQIASLARSS